MELVALYCLGKKKNYYVSLLITAFPGPVQLSVACSKRTQAGRGLIQTRRKQIWNGPAELQRKERA